jgi:hypothetical protein
MHRPVLFALLFVLACVAGHAQETPPPILLSADRVYDGQATHAGWIVVVRGGRIEAAGPKARDTRTSG